MDCAGVGALGELPWAGSLGAEDSWIGSLLCVWKDREAAARSPFLQNGLNLTMYKKGTNLNYTLRAPTSLLLSLNKYHSDWLLTIILKDLALLLSELLISCK